MTWQLVAAVVVGTLAVARATRLVTSDAYPPVEHARIWWEVRQANREAQSNARPGTFAAMRTGWASLVTCPFCFAPYAAAVNLVWAVWSGAAWTDWTMGVWSWEGMWWIVNVWAAVSYVAAMVVVRDEPPAE